MQYLLIYLLIGIVVAIVMAYVQEYHLQKQQLRASSGMLVGAYLFIALAWPVSIAAFIYGALQQVLVTTQERDQT